MTKQAVFYEKVIPVNSKRHANVSVRTGSDYSYARQASSVPLTAVEFTHAASAYPIVFAGSDDDVMPMAVLGVVQDRNHYVDAAGKWSAGYIPAFVRRYPFVFSSSDDGSTFTLCIDETFTGCNEAGRGERLFDTDGERTRYLNGVLGFQQEYQAHFTATRNFCARLKELDLLEPAEARFTTPQGQQHALTGLLVINREKLNALSDGQLAGLVRSGQLELVYLHLHSLRHLREMAGDIEERAPAAQETDSDAMPATDADRSVH